jgi:hypothetical protein
VTGYVPAERSPARQVEPERPDGGDGAMSKLSTEEREDLESGDFAFPRQRKAPLEDPAHVRNAIARFNQVKDVSDDERDSAWKRIKAAAKKHGVEVSEKSWREIGK